jgi:hypothetical protein
MRKYFVKQEVGTGRWFVVCNLHGKDIVVEVKNSQASALAIATKLRNHYKAKEEK